MHLLQLLRWRLLHGTVNTILNDAWAVIRRTGQPAGGGAMSYRRILVTVGVRRQRLGVAI
jgi:hypothetical protein